MFDNGRDGDGGGAGTHSRFLREYDEDALVARVRWEWSTDMDSLVYGDADRLPSGNVLGTAWPFEVDASGTHGAEAGDVQYDAVVYEAHGASAQVAWKLGVRSWQLSLDAETYRHADQHEPVGWGIYSAERFFRAAARAVRGPPRCRARAGSSPPRRTTRTSRASRRRGSSRCAARPRRRGAVGRRARRVRVRRQLGERGARRRVTCGSTTHHRRDRGDRIQKAGEVQFSLTRFYDCIDI